VLVTPGANMIIYLAINCLANKGEEVIVPDPGFPTYYSVIKLSQIIPVRVPLKEENCFRMNPDDIRKAITPKRPAYNPDSGVFEERGWEMISRPLEDMFPFLDREIFKKR